MGEMWTAQDFRHPLCVMGHVPKDKGDYLYLFLLLCRKSPQVLNY
jgi:hypothetical protein